MIKKLLAGPTTSVVSAAVIVASFSMLSRIVGFVRDRILAGIFGAGDALDVYYASFRIPDAIFQLIIIGALSACFIPVFTGYFGKDNRKAWTYTNNILNLLLITFGIVAVVGAVLAPYYTPWLTPGFSADKQALVVQVTRVLFLGQMFFSLSMVYGSVLQGAKRFVLYSFAPIVNNFGILFGAIALVPWLGLMGLAWGAVLGASLHALIQTVGVYALGYQYAWRLDWRDADVRQTLRQMGPRVMGIGVGQLTFLLMTVIATSLTAGSVTILQFAYNLNFFPIGIIGVSYAIAAFPTFCEYVNHNALDKLRDSFSATVRQVLFFIIPATVLFLLLRAQAVRLIFGAGVFDWQATIATADTLAMFALSFFAQSLVFVVVRVYFAFEDSWTPFWAGILSAVVSGLGGWWLSGSYGVSGLAAAFSAGSMIQLCVLWLFLKRKVGSLRERDIVKSTIVLTLAGIIAGLVAQAVKYSVVDYIQLDTFFNVFLQASIAGGVGFVMYILAAWLLHSPEMKVFTAGLRARFMKTAKSPEIISET
jgi:putative peptidoglycan lipid II flippase